MTEDTTFQSQVLEHLSTEPQNTVSSKYLSSVVFTAINCQYPPTFSNATVRVFDSALNVGTKAKYSCLPDFTMAEGNATSICLVTGEWSVINISGECKWKLKPKQ